MFMAMRGRPREKTCNCSCKCEGSCVSCHSEEKIFPFLIPITFPIVFPIVFPGLLFLAAAGFLDKTTRHIQVDGKDCIEQTIVDNCNSTGSCKTHDIAVCPK